MRLETAVYTSPDSCLRATVKIADEAIFCAKKVFEILSHSRASVVDGEPR